MMIRILLICAVLCLPSPVQAETLTGPIKAEVLEVIDGDTLMVRVHIWLGQAIETKVRLSGIDTPEIRSRCKDEKKRAEQAKQALTQLIQDHGIELYDIHHGKFAGRVIAKARLDSGQDISDYLIRNGHARAYEGKKRKSWCIS